MYKYKKPQKDREEKLADEYANRVLSHVIYKLYTKEQVDIEHEKIAKILNKKSQT